MSLKSDTPRSPSWDSEKQDIVVSDIAADGADIPSSTSEKLGFLQYTVKWLSEWGIETNGYVTLQGASPSMHDGDLRIDFRITPVPPRERTDTRLYQMFFVWFSANANILTYAQS